MHRRTGSILLAGTLALGGIAFAPARAFASSEESRFTSLLNHERSSRGGRTLVTKSDLVSIARRHSQDMAERGYIYHNNSLGNQVHGDWRMLGENVGRGGSVDSIHNAFMNSAPHRRNILESRFNQVGVGTAIKGEYIYVTEVFAARGSSSPPRVVRHRPRARHHAVVRSRPARRARPRPRPRVLPPAPRSPQTVEILVRLIGLDARRVNPSTGAALGL